MDSGKFAALGRRDSTRRIAIAVLFLGICLLAAWNGFWRLGYSTLSDSDEARYGVAAAEMRHSGAALVATYAGEEEFWNLKPPLGYWLIEGAYAAFGENTFALRFPAACAALLTVIATMLYARRRFGDGPALIAGAVLATAAGVYGHHAARSGDLDATVMMLLTLALFLSDAPALTPRRQLAIGAVLATTFLVKSFELIPYVAALALFDLCRDGWARSRAAWIRIGAIVAGVALAWALARSIAGGSVEFVRRMVVEDLFLRTAEVIDPGQENHGWDYAAALLDRFAPWTIVLGAVVTMRLFRRHAERPTGAVVRLIVFVAVPVVAFSIARTHHFQYVLPTLPALAVLTGVAVAELLRCGAPSRRAVLMATLAVLLVACEARVTIHTLHDDRPPSQAFLAHLPIVLGADQRPLLTAFAPGHAERFLLQTSLGAPLTELAAAQTAVVQPKLGVTVLYRQGAVDVGEVIASGGGYVAVRLAQGTRLSSVPRPAEPADANGRDAASVAIAGVLPSALGAMVPSLGAHSANASVASIGP